MIYAPPITGLGHLVGPVWRARCIAGPRHGMPPSVTASLLGDIIGNRSYPEEEDEQTAKTGPRPRSAAAGRGDASRTGAGRCRTIYAPTTIMTTEVTSSATPVTASGQRQRSLRRGVSRGATRVGAVCMVSPHAETLPMPPRCRIAALIPMALSPVLAFGLSPARKPTAAVWRDGKPASRRLGGALVHFR